MARTDGNPFYVRETARLLASEGELVAVAEVPAGVRDVIRRRVARLPAHAQTVLRLAAVVGRDIDVDVLLAADDADEDQSLDAVEAGVMAGLLLEPAVGRLRFAHGLVQDTLYDDISRLRRSRLHGRIAEVMERVGSTGLRRHHPPPARGRLTGRDREGRGLRRPGRRAGREPVRADRRHRPVGAGGRPARAACRTRTRAERVDLLVRLARAHGNAGSLQLRECLHRAIDEAARDRRHAAGRPGRHRLGRRPVLEPARLRPDRRQAAQLDRDRAGRAPGRPRSGCAARLLACRALELEGSFEDAGYQSALDAVALARTLPDDPAALPRSP